MDPKKHLGFTLHKIGSMMEHCSDGVLFEKFGIGFSQFKVLFILEHHSGIQQNEIAVFLSQTEASISRQIKLMARAEFLRVEKDAKDRKKHHITLTTKGRNLASEALMTLNDYYEPILSVLSARDQELLTEKLGLIQERLMLNKVSNN